jgi:hypothetical protein
VEALMSIEARDLARLRLGVTAAREVGCRIVAGRPAEIITGILLAAADELRRQHGPRAVYDCLQQAADHAARPLIK